MEYPAVAMWCVICQHDLIARECKDIEERLASLRDSAMWPAALMNLQSRKRESAMEELLNSEEKKCGKA